MSVAVIGGGIVGLAVARELTLRQPGSAVTVFEKEDRLAAHQSGHNSGVLHAGVYYPPGSLKAELCLRGGRLLREFCADRDIALRDVGKLVVATSERELDGLAELERRARHNGVPDLRRLDAHEIGGIEPHVRGLAALHSPHTASIDYVAVCVALGKEIVASGGQVRLNTPVTSLASSGTGIDVDTRGERRHFDRLIVCAGLHSDRLATQLGWPGNERILPFRGEYYELRASAGTLVRGMVYPVPDPRYPFLGVHLTRNVNDRVHVGPNAVLALALEGYRRRDLSLRESADLARWPGTWRLARAHWRSGASEVAGSLSKRRYLSRARQYVPELTLEDLVGFSSGVRAQAVRRDGSLVDDFVLQTVGPVTLVRNAPSPAATSSLAIAEHIVTVVGH